MTGLKEYASVTASYWAFTLTDGALRMLVLLHFNSLGYSPLDIAFLFLLYEVMGILTNLVGGWIGAKLGLKITLFAGLATQIFALFLLSLLDPTWGTVLSVAYVMGAQALAGVAKDLTKMSSKSAVKLVVKGGDGIDTDSRLFKWVAILTGSKNALKGVGFFLGGALLAGLGFQGALWAMAGMLVLVLGAALITLKGDMGKAKEKVKAKHLFAKTRAINILSFARVFLFASRDVWFVVALPVFLTTQLGWGFAETGGFMASWVIGYGFVQAGAPKLMGKNKGPSAAKIWGLSLAVLPALGAFGLAQGWHPETVIFVCLAIYGVIFAVNSSLHSYLILFYSDKDKVALNVGFYYMANAVGRLSGTLLSGLVYMQGGLVVCLWVSAGLAALAGAIAIALPNEKGIEAEAGDPQSVKP